VTIELQSNFMLLGDRDLTSIDIDRPSLTLAELLEEIAGQSNNTLQFLAAGTNVLDEGWEVEVNGLAFADLAQGIATALRDGDRVAIKLSLLGGG